MKTHLTACGSIFVMLLLAAASCFGALAPTDLTCEYRKDPLGIDNPKPRLSWKLVGDQESRGQKQDGWQVLVASSMENLDAGRGDLWDRGVVRDSESQHRVYGGKPLESGRTCFWKVRVEDGSGNFSDWSPPAKFSMGLLDPQDWKGQWIQRKDQAMTDHNWFRKNFQLKEAPRSAYIYLASFGYCGTGRVDMRQR